MTSRTKVPLRVPGSSPHTGCMRRVVPLVFVLLAVSAGAAAASGGGDVRVAGSCGRGVTSSLRIDGRDNGIEVRFRLRQTRGRGAWRITLVHENRVAARATRRTTRSEDSFELRRTIPDLPGSDAVVVHAWGPRGLGCRAAATLPDSA
jgi:hypothetical protein